MDEIIFTVHYTVCFRGHEEGKILPAEFPDPLPGGWWLWRLAWPGPGEASRGIQLEVSHPYFYTVLRIRDPGLGAFWPLDPGSGIGFFRIPNPGSRIPDPGSQNHIFKSLVTKFWGKGSIILWKPTHIFFFHFKNKIIYNFVKLVATKKDMKTNFFSPLFFVAVFGSGIRDNHPGHATLISRLCFRLGFRIKLFHIHDTLGLTVFLLVSFALSCDGLFRAADPAEQVCSCRPNYVGDRCEHCGPGYFGQPDQPGTHVL